MAAECFHAVFEADESGSFVKLGTSATVIASTCDQGGHPPQGGLLLGKNSKLVAAALQFGAGVSLGGAPGAPVIPIVGRIAPPSRVMPLRHRCAGEGGVARRRRLLDELESIVPFGLLWCRR
jgi:hypothetical protein